MGENKNKFMATNNLTSWNILGCVVNRAVAHNEVVETLWARLHFFLIGTLSGQASLRIQKGCGFQGYLLLKIIPRLQETLATRESERLESLELLFSETWGDGEISYCISDSLSLIVEL